MAMTPKELLNQLMQTEGAMCAALVDSNSGMLLESVGTGVDHDALGAGLKKAIYNYMHGIGLEEDVRMWFPFKVPKTTVRRDRIERALQQRG